MLSGLEETHSQLFFLSLAGIGLNYGHFQIYPENAETILYLAIVRGGS